VSLKPRAVPVLAATRNGRSNGSSMPKPGRRASGSASMSIASHDASGENARRSSGRGGSQRVPSARSTHATPCGVPTAPALTVKP